MLSSVDSPVFSHLFNRLLQHYCRVFQSDLVKRRQNIGVCEMFFSLDFDGSRVFHLGVNSCFGSVIDPFPNKNFILLRKEVRPLAFPLIIDPMSFKVITTSFGEYSISNPFAHIPHSLINVSVRIDHSTLPMR